MKPDCRYYIATDEHVFCANPRVHLPATGNYLTLTHGGNVKPATQCDRCTWSNVDLPPRQLIDVDQIIARIQSRKFTKPEPKHDEQEHDSKKTTDTNTTATGCCGGTTIEEWRIKVAPKVWARLHIKSLELDELILKPDAKQKRFLKLLQETAHILPCPECLADMQAYVNEHPYQLGDNCFEWGWRFHNHKNRQLGKSEVSLDDAIERAT